MIFDFNSTSNNKNWRIVNDDVMGGISTSSFSINSDGNGVFEGHVSLENYGGFSSVRYQSKNITIENCNSFQMRIKGDGKSYQFRIRSSLSDSHTYKFTFKTDKTWQIITIPFIHLSPTFRGRDLRIPNFNGNKVEEVGFLISNKKEEDFQLEIDYIKSI